LVDLIQVVKPIFTSEKYGVLCLQRIHKMILRKVLILSIVATAMYLGYLSVNFLKKKIKVHRNIGGFHPVLYRYMYTYLLTWIYFWRIQEFFL